MSRPPPEHRAKAGESWLADVSGRVSWAHDNESVGTKAVIVLTWASDDGYVVEGYVQPPRVSSTRLPCKTSLPAGRLLRRITLAEEAHQGHLP